MIITIDGPAAAGKTSSAKALAERLGFQYIDTGALYRALAVGIQRLGRQYSQDDLEQMQIGMKNGQVFLNGENVSGFIRTEEIGKLASSISADPMVRSHLLMLQRNLGKSADSILEGRDTGSVIFPDAEIRFFLTASPAVRAQRRLGQLQEKGIASSYETILCDLNWRDEQDSSRPVAPLKYVPGMIWLDNEQYNLEETVERMLSEIQKAFPDLRIADATKSFPVELSDIQGKVFDIIENALARAGYRIVDGYDDTIIVRDPKNDIDFQVKLIEEVE